MAILAIFTGDGFTKKMYDDLIRVVGWKASHPIGGIVHIASFDEKGNAHVADVWESQEALDNFASSLLMPAMKKAKVPIPDMKVYQVHNIDAYRAIEKYVRN